VHKYKNIVQQIRAIAMDTGAEEQEEGISRARLVKVAKKLEMTAEDPKDKRMYNALVLALLGKTDALSQASLMWVLVCPAFIEALEAEPSCWREHTVLYILGMAYLSWDMPNRTDTDRCYHLELCEAVLVYVLGGEQLYLPFTNESEKGSEPGLVGILSATTGQFTSQNLLAFLGNSAARRQVPQPCFTPDRTHPSPPPPPP
jgi:hypothetical protein